MKKSNKKINVKKRKETDSYYLITKDENGNLISFDVDNPNK